MYLLFSATYHEVPLAMDMDMKVKECLEKSGSAENAALWNWTPLQKSILDADLPRVIMTSYWSTGKTRILFVKALKLAKDGKFVIFVLHYSQIKKEEDFAKDEEESLETNFADHAPILLYHSLMNEIDKESEKNPQVKANIKLMLSKDLEGDILEKNTFHIGELVKELKTLKGTAINDIQTFLTYSTIPFDFF